MDSAEKTGRFSFLGGALPLDFCNTADWHSSEQPIERFLRYADIAAWAEEAGVVEPDDRRTLEEDADLRPHAAEAAREEAVRFRETLFRAFSAVARGVSPGGSDLREIERRYHAAQTRRRLADREGRIGWEWNFSGGEPLTDRILCPIAQAAAELLTSPQKDKIRRCEGPPGCGWLFLDATKNRSRRWCSMRDCGNREKARRFQQRKKRRPES